MHQTQAVNFMKTQKEMLIRNVVLANACDRKIANMLDSQLQAVYLLEECEVSSFSINLVIVSRKTQALTVKPFLS
jgi:hypothetical protein